MKSQYRQAVESVISQEAKLAEVSRLHNEALAHVAETTKWLALNEKTLEEYEGRLAGLEAANPNGEPGRIDRLESEVDDLRRSFKRIAGCYLSGKPPIDGLPLEA